MNGDGGKRKVPKRGMTSEDRALWNKVSRDIKPLKSPKQVRGDSIESAREADSRETIQKKIAKNQRVTPTKDGLSGGRRGGSQHLPAKPSVPDEGKAAVAAVDLAKFDGREVRRISSGRTQIDARLDLHGLRQSEAHTALRRFLISSSARGCRTVLVITGKGARAMDNEADWSSSIGAERGVLKRMVPLWLSEPDLRSVVVSYTSAHVRHGGEGALYIRLRRMSR